MHSFWMSINTPGPATALWISETTLAVSSERYQQLFHLSGYQINLTTKKLVTRRYRAFLRDLHHAGGGTTELGTAATRRGQAHEAESV